MTSEDNVTILDIDWTCDEGFVRKLGSFILEEDNIMGSSISEKVIFAITGQGRLYIEDIPDIMEDEMAFINQIQVKIQCMCIGIGRGKESF